MDLKEIQTTFLTNNGQDLHDIIRDLYPVCRSITGDGVRLTLQHIQSHINNLIIHEVKSGSKVLDWTVPLEWNIKDAYIKLITGERIIDFNKNNLHVMSYSIPINKRCTLEELKKHIYTIPTQPDAIPYKTSYYKKDWGFCLTTNQLKHLTDSEYDICIDSSFTEGSLTYGELYLPGKRKDEVLVSTHICHPSLCNDNLSGIAVSIYLIKVINRIQREYSYRFIFIPATIGAITWLNNNKRKVKNIKNGIVLAGVGDSGNPTYKKSRQETTNINKIMAHLQKNYKINIIDFFPYGYDERQFCSPGFNLPVGCLMRTPNSLYKEYHTSEDNLDFVKPAALQDSLSLMLDVLFIIENNTVPINVYPYGEPQLGKRGLYKTIDKSETNQEMLFLWVLNLSDGYHTLLDIANKANVPFKNIYSAFKILNQHKLIRTKKVKC